MPPVATGLDATRFALIGFCRGKPLLGDISRSASVKDCLVTKNDREMAYWCDGLIGFVMPQNC